MLPGIRQSHGTFWTSCLLQFCTGLNGSKQVCRLYLHNACTTCSHCYRGKFASSLNEVFIITKKNSHCYNDHPEPGPPLHSSMESTFLRIIEFSLILVIIIFSNNLFNYLKNRPGLSLRAGSLSSERITN